MREFFFACVLKINENKKNDKLGAANGVQASPVMQMQNQGGDYSTEWAEYYRRIGKNDEAEAIEKQIQANKVINSFIG